MKKRAPISTIMTSELKTVNPTHKISDVIDIFKENDFHHLPVVSGDDLLGLISRTDIDKITYFTDASGDDVNTSVYNVVAIDQVMTKNLDTISSESFIKDAAEILANGDYHAIPVVDDGKLSGIVTSTDVIRYLVDQYD